MSSSIMITSSVAIIRKLSVFELKKYFENTRLIICAEIRSKELDLKLFHEGLKGHVPLSCT